MRFLTKVRSISHAFCMQLYNFVIFNEFYCIVVLFVTPLGRVRRLLRIFGYLLLFPMYLRGEELRRSPFLLLKMLLAFFVSFCFLLYQGFVVWDQMGSYSLSNLMDMLAGAGLEISSIAMGSYIATSLASLILTDVLFLLSGGIAKSLTDTLGLIAEIALEHRRDLGRRSLRSYLGFQLIGVFLAVVSLTVYSLMGNLMYPTFIGPYTDNNFVRVATVLWFALGQFFLFWSPPMLVFESFMTYVVECVCEGYDIVAELARDETKSGRKKSLQLGFKVEKILQDLGKSFGTVLVFNLAAILVVISANLFCLLDLFFQQHQWNQMKRLMLLRHLAENSMYILTSALLCHCGQRLEDGRLRARRSLEDLSRTLHKKDDDSSAMEKDLMVLTSRMGQEAPLRPHSFISVNHRGFLGIMSSSVTYLIVLLQFKTSK